MFTFKRLSNKTLCPVQGLEVYVSVCKLIGIKLAPGFLFCPVTKSNTVSSVVRIFGCSSKAVILYLLTEEAVIRQAFNFSWFSVQSCRVSCS